MAKLTGAQAVVESLLAQGVDTVFGIISVHTIDIYDALYDHQDAIRFISARHEHAAATMADGYARATGKPGVCITSTGPGAAYSMGGLGEGFASSSPILNITSTAEEKVYERGLGATHDTKDQLGMLNSVTQWACHVSSADAVPDRIYEAFARFQTRRPQPISIEIPVDVQAEQAEMEIPQLTKLAPPAGDPALVQRAARGLLAGKRVAIWAGAGVLRSGASEALVRLAETLGIPVLTTQEAKGAMPESHPLNLGVFGAIPPSLKPLPVQDPLRVFFESLDTVLVVGSSLSYIKTRSQDLHMPPNLIHVDIDLDCMGRLYHPVVGVAGDARLVLEQLQDEVQGKQPALEQGSGAEVKEVKAKSSSYWWQFMPNPMKAFETIRKVISPDAIFTGDANVAVLRGATYCLPLDQPRAYFTPHWLGLGFAFPAAVGAKAGMPDRQVICMTGDGGFQFNIQEIGTCVQYGISPVVLVFNDNAWGILKMRQRDLMGGRYIGTDLVNPDFVKLAEAYGANGVRVNSVKELVPALEQALKSNVITLIDVQTPGGIENFK